jgi:Acetylornithine deacetylase/Succinyl-diaminopimelate desuccinylase and related deacylases
MNKDTGYYKISLCWLSMHFQSQSYENQCDNWIFLCFKVKLLQHRWRFPSLSIHGIEGAFSEPGCKTVIPRKVIGKFSIRIVPNQTPEKVEQVVVAYLNKQWKERGSTNKMKVYSTLLCPNVLTSSVWNTCKNYSYSETLLRIMTITRDIMWQELFYNNSVELNSSWEVNCHSSSEEISLVL